MRQPILSPDRFAEWFNNVVPGAYRSITAQDIRDMTECGLVAHYGYYIRQDLETVRAILLYEQLRERRIQESCLQDTPKTCKSCGKLLPDNEGSRGRPSEYCSECEPLRGRERYRKWWEKQTIPIYKTKNGLVTADT